MTMETIFLSFNHNTFHGLVCGKPKTLTQKFPLLLNEEKKIRDHNQKVHTINSKIYIYSNFLQKFIPKRIKRPLGADAGGTPARQVKGIS